MQTGRVIGSIVSTQKHESLVGLKLMIIQYVDGNQEPLPSYEVAGDTVSAGIGEYVLLTRGSSARHVFGDGQDINSAVDCAIVGIIDSFDK